MISDFSTTNVNALSLSGADGLFLLVTRALDRLKPGEVLNVASDNPSAEHDLPAWCRLTANPYLGKKSEKGRAVHRIEKGRAARILVDSDLDWNNHAKVSDGHMDTRSWLVGRTAIIRQRAVPSDGFAPRGAAVEVGSPEFTFDVLDRTHAWGESAAAFYDQAKAAYWDASRDIPWSQLGPLDEELERAICQLMTFLAENEFSALYVPARWIARIHPHFMETILFLSTQVSDEARHIEVFVKRALANGGGLQFSSASTQASLKSLLDQDQFVAASFLLSVLGEGTFLDLLRYVEQHAPDSVTREIAHRTRIDETRHVHFALAHIRNALRTDSSIKDMLRRAMTERASVLAGVKGLNPLVDESLVILAAGGLSPENLPRAIQTRAELYRTMHENRVRRLITVGFAEREAEQLSELHTPNFM